MTAHPASALVAFLDDVVRPPARVLRDARSAQRGDLTPDTVHDLRVATRRLRSDLRSLQPLLRRKRVRRLRQRLRGLDNHLRPVRDADVLCMSFEQSIARIAEPLDPETIAAIRGQLEIAAAQGRADLIAAFGTPQIRRLLRDCDDIRGKRIARGGNLSARNATGLALRGTAS